MTHDFETEDEEGRQYIWRSHLDQIEWQPNPYRSRVEARDHEAIPKALVFAAGHRPTSLTEALLIDARLGVMPRLGAEICVANVK